jgi:UDP-3-O-[3-hydroxymyristoyl] N-acetylglucosamine deacetylase
MNIIHMEGYCLSGLRSQVEIQKSDRFALYSHHNSRAPVEVVYEIDNIMVDNHVVSVGGQCRVGVVEHLFSTLYGMKLFNVRIDVYGKEIPFFDGSSAYFTRKVQELNNDHMQGTRLASPIQVCDASGSIHYVPWDGDELVVEMSLTHPYINMQNLAIKITPASYAKEIAPARTFVFTDEHDTRLKDLPPYGIGITRDNVYAKTPLRFPDEPVRHKILDLLGELYILKRPIFGKITARNTSHRLNLQFMSKLLSALRKNG